jgi:hypothetical protein
MVTKRAGSVSIDRDQYEPPASEKGVPHASTFTPTGSQNWTTIVPAGMTAPFEILSIDLAKKRIGVALVAEEERDDYTGPPDETSTKGFGSMADKLKDVLGPKQR